MYYDAITFNFANRSNSFLSPPLLKFISAFVSAPVPSIF